VPARERFEVVEGQGARGRKTTPRASTAESKFEARREQIVDAAVTQLNRHGIRGMTLSNVAERLSLAPSAVGYYFRRKEDLAAACYYASLTRLSAKVDQAAATGGKQPLQALVRLLFDYRRRVELGEEAEIAWHEDVRTIGNDEVNAAYVDFFRKIRALFGEAKGEEARAARNARTHLFLSELYWAVSWLPKYHPHDYMRMADRLIDILENGLAAPGRGFEPRPLAIKLHDEDDPKLMFLRAATELINERGYLGASVQKISARLNVTKGAFYHRHDAKSDLVGQCFERTWRLVAETQVAADVATSTGLRNIASVASFLVEHQLSGDLPLMRSAALAAAPAELRPDLVAGFDRIANRFASVISDGLKDGSIRPVEVGVAAYTVNGAINAAAELHFWAPGMEPAQITRHYLEPLFTGLLPKA